MNTFRRWTIGEIAALKQSLPDALRFVEWSVHEAALAQAVQPLERKYRMLLWKSHGCQGLYGDDGEMRCANAKRHGLLDFKRMSLEVLENALFEMTVREVSEAQQAIREAAP